ncbi:MAG: hypothetical protein JO258_11965 [Alphaproteobacteria bacterium]|nr:hypothetical protein [Alphaproteobacteria bacterium]
MLLLVRGVVYLAAATPLVALYESRQEALDGRRVLAAKLTAAAERMPGLRERASQLRASSGENRVVLEGASDALAAAGLQSRLEEMASATGATIASSESLPSEPREGFRRVGIRLAVSGRYDSLLHFFAALESAAPPLVVDNARLSGGLAAVTAGGAAPLTASLEIAGLRAAGATAAAAAPGEGAAK